MSQGLAITLIILVAVLAIAGLVIGGMFLWRRTVRRYVVTLISKREGVQSAFRIVETLMGKLLVMSDGELVAFALDPTAEERKTLEEVGEQMGILADELATMPLPKRLWDSANALADAARELKRQTAGLNGKEGIEALDALSSIDLAKVRVHVEAGVALLGEQAERYELDDTAVYGGGLYI